MMGHAVPRWLHRAVPCHTGCSMLRYAVLCHAMLAVPYHAVPCWQRSAILGRATLAMLCHTTLCCAVLGCGGNTVPWWANMWW